MGVYNCKQPCYSVRTVTIDNCTCIKAKHNNVFSAIMVWIRSQAQGDKCILNLQLHEN